MPGSRSGLSLHKSEEAGEMETTSGSHVIEYFSSILTTAKSACKQLQRYEQAVLRMQRQRNAAGSQPVIAGATDIHAPVGLRSSLISLAALAEQGQRQVLAAEKVRWRSVRMLVVNRHITLRSSTETTWDT